MNAAAAKARCCVHSRGQPRKKNFWNCEEFRFVRGAPRAPSRKRVRGCVSVCKGASRASASARRLVDVGAAGVPAFLTSEPFAEVGDPEALAQLVGEARREQQAAMLAAPADGDEGGLAADQVGQR